MDHPTDDESYQPKIGGHLALRLAISGAVIAGLAWVLWWAMAILADL